MILTANNQGRNGSFTFTMNVVGPLEEELDAATGSSDAREELIDHLYSSAATALMPVSALVSASNYKARKNGDGEFKNEYKIEVTHGTTTVQYNVALDLNVHLNEENVNALIAPIMQFLEIDTRAHLTYPSDYDRAHRVLSYEIHRAILDVFPVDLWLIDMPPLGRSRWGRPFF